MTTLLNRIQSPHDLKALTLEQLHQLAGEIRERIVNVVSRTGGHISSNLGVVELTMALHRVFDFRSDRLLWDVGHQCYVHKLLTGRNERFETLRQTGGVSGFPSIDESPYDLFNVGHAGTAIPTAVGMARADAALGSSARTVALVGDASIVNGVAFEGLNQAGILKRQFLVVLNDNSMGIAKTQGGLAETLARFRLSHLYEDVKSKVKTILSHVPVVGRPVVGAIEHLKQGVKATMAPDQIFEQLGFMYVGPVDGHDLQHLIELLELLKDVDTPVLLHVHTQKGKGCDWASQDPCAYHSPNKVVLEGGKAVLAKDAGRKSWTAAFADTFLTLARHDPKMVVLTAAMPDGTGVNKVLKELPNQALDCGIAESCTVDIAAGMAKAGLRPIAAIYSTFLQRAFDQVFQEVVLQGLPVGFCIDRAGLVGGDGAVHHGYLDLAYLRSFQNIVLMAPADEHELLETLKLGRQLDQPYAIRYPRDVVPVPSDPTPAFVLGRSRLMRDGHHATILAYGTPLEHALAAAEALASEAISVRVVNARFCKPIDDDMVTTAITRGGPVITVEDHSVAGGFGSSVLEAANRLGLPTDSIVRLGHAENRFYSHGSRAGQLAEAGIDTAGIAAAVRRLVAASRAAGASSTPIERSPTPNQG